MRRSNETDSFQVILDTFGDQQNGFIFGTNPAGIEYDAQIIGGGTNLFGGGGRRRSVPVCGEQLQPQLGRRLDRRGEDWRLRVVGRDGDPLPLSSLRWR